jgi:hypothetical protein
MKIEHAVRIGCLVDGTKKQAIDFATNKLNIRVNIGSSKGTIITTILLHITKN